MKKRALLAVIAAALTLCLLVACGGSEKLPVSDSAYAEYVGSQFSGQDPWGGELTVTVRSIVDGRMDWTFTDAYDGHTLYQEQSGAELRDGALEYSVSGKDVENKSVSFSYQGTMELRDGQITFCFSKGSVTDSSGGASSDSREAEALKDGSVVLVKAADESLMPYTVQEGDSIHSIAKQFHTTTRELAIINQTVIIETAQAHGHQYDDVIEYAKYLFPGEVLLVPKD